MRRHEMLLALAGLAASWASIAVAPFATGQFLREEPNSDKLTPITSATMGDMVCLRLRDVSTLDGDHSLKLVVYDGGGTEVQQTISRVTAVGGKWGYLSCRRPDEDRDQPGTWWFVTELDDQPLVSKEINIGRPQ